jgi:hypothetical protein
MGPLLLELADMLHARMVVVIAGPIFGYHARRTSDLWNLTEAGTPLTWTGEAYGWE